MLKMLIVAALVVGVLMVGGVLEVKVHTDQVAQVPSRVLGLVSNTSTIEKARTFAVKWKREGEQAITKDDSQKFKLAVGYMQADADRLQELTDKGAASEAIVPQAQLLSESVERVRTQGEKVPVATLTEEHDSSRTAFAKAQESLQKLEELRAKHADLQAQFERITASLNNSLQGGAVAGAKDTVKPTTSPTTRPINGVPLSF